MKIIQSVEGTTLKLELYGRLISGATDELEDIFKNKLTNIKELVIDSSNLEFVSSAGLRILLLAHKNIKDDGNIVIINANDAVKEIFKLTGFNEIFTIK